MDLKIYRKSITYGFILCDFHLSTHYRLCSLVVSLSKCKNKICSLVDHSVI
jgi:hypothetical protein